MKYVFQLMILSTFLFACSNNNNDPQPNQAIVANDNSPTSGSLIVTVFGENNQTVQGASVSLYFTDTAFDKDIPVFTVFTNRNGLADFGFINIDNYFVRAYYSVNRENFEAVGAVQVRSQRDERKDLKLVRL